MISKVKYKNEEFSYPVFEYLYPYLIKRVWRKELESQLNNVLVIPERFVVEFKVLLKSIMVELLEEFYEKPEKDDLLEYKGRYERIVLNQNEYILNIATNGKDRVVFQIFSLYQWITEVSQEE